MTRAVAVAVLLAAIVAGCSSPEQQLRESAEQAVREASSEVGTTRLAVQQLLDHKLWRQPAEQLVRDAEKSLSAAASGFAAEQPETEESRRTYDEVTVALDEAESSVTATRIALANGDLAAAARQLPVLDQVADRLQEVAG
jgi:hypothetical protein